VIGAQSRSEGDLSWGGDPSTFLNKIEGKREGSEDSWDASGGEARLLEFEIII